MAGHRVVKISPQTVEHLHKLVQANLDGVKGYRTAAELLDDDAAIGLFEDLQRQRDRFAGRLQALLTEMGIPPPTDASVLGSAHRWWLRARAKVSEGNPQIVFSDIEFGEDYLRDLYEKALDGCTEQPVQRILTEQHESVQQAHAMMREKRDAAHAAE